VIEAEMAGVDLIELMKGAHSVILIDAARSGQAAPAMPSGSRRRSSWPEQWTSFQPPSSCTELR
jgi:hypothetical protein